MMHITQNIYDYQYIRVFKIEYYEVRSNKRG